MKKDAVTTEIIVQENKIGIMRVGNVNYISLSDLARYKDKERTDYIIQNWMRNTNTIHFLGTWEYLNNQNLIPSNSMGLKMNLEQMLLL